MTKAILLLFVVCLTEALSYKMWAVSLGYSVTASSIYDANYFNYKLKSVGRPGVVASCWSAGVNNADQWIQVSSPDKQEWTGVLTQGRGDLDQWVTSYIVWHSLDGIVWELVDNGKVFKANSDRNTLVANHFDNSVIARGLRIQPRSWYGGVSMRFDAIAEVN